MNKRIFIEYSAKKWLKIVLVFVLLSGFMSSILLLQLTDNVWLIITGIILIASLFGLIGGLFALMDKQRQELKFENHEIKRQIQATINVRPLIKYPLNIGGWAITPQFLERLATEIQLRKPNLIVECGSGTSTIVMAACLEILGNGKIISLDHEKKYAEITEKQLRMEGLQERVDIVFAPLKETLIGKKSWNWYDFNVEEHFDNTIDMLIVDGPPGEMQNLSRYPAFPIFQKYLSDDFLIMIDDGKRKDEIETIERWGDLSKVKTSFVNTERGYWILENEA